MGEEHTVPRTADEKTDCVDRRNYVTKSAQHAALLRGGA